MKQFEKKRRIKRLMYSKLMIIVLLFVLFILARGAWGVYGKSQESLARKNMSAVELARLEDRKVKLEEKIGRLDSKVGIEEELRVRYSLSKEGEKVIVIIDEEPPVQITEEKPGMIKSFLRKINLVE